MKSVQCREKTRIYFVIAKIQKVKGIKKRSAKHSFSMSIKVEIIT